MQRVDLGVVAALAMLLTCLTVFGLAVSGPEILIAASLLVVAVLAFEVFGAFSTPRDGR